MARRYITDKDHAKLRQMGKSWMAGKGVLSKRPVPTRRRHAGGGGGGGTVEVNLRFGRVSEEVTKATGWAVADAGTGSVEILTDAGTVDEEVTAKNRYFDDIPLNSAVWVFTIGANHFVVNAGCGLG